jgi:hypothetical protein
MKIKIGPFKKKGDRKVEIRIDKYDTYDTFTTLAMIIKPVLEAHKATKQGIPGFVFSPEHFDEKTPEWRKIELEKESADKWNEILDKMIFSFDTDLHFDLENQISDFQSEEFKQLQERILEGRRLFAEHFEALWT